MIDIRITKNDVMLHIVDREYLLSLGYPDELIIANFYQIPNTSHYITNRLTFGQMAQFVLGGASYDFALPAGLPAYYFGKAVWLYDEHSPITGRLFNVADTFHSLVATMLGGREE